MNSISITQLAQEINFQASSKDDVLTERNIEMLKKYYENMFESLCGQIPKFRIIDQKGRIEIYDL